ncbi:hypothetical protein WA026_018022 [Henosepilachna vigintioctopunctata]|uniref:Uncharacterized protein n=1 Tax=Henosepilachna vigintioctopunctata TaxID=420089 RepID=A0AAW1UL62_9CUCU
MFYLYKKEDITSIRVEFVCIFALGQLSSGYALFNLKMKTCMFYGERILYTTFAFANLNSDIQLILESDPEGIYSEVFRAETHVAQIASFSVILTPTVFPMMLKYKYDGITKFKQKYADNLFVFRLCTDKKLSHISL